MNILITGATGYIGSLTVFALIGRGHKLFLYDNLSNSRRLVLDRLEALAGKNFSFTEGDVFDTELLKQIFFDKNIDLVIHLVAPKHFLTESAQPENQQSSHIESVFSLVEAMKKSGVKKLIYSSSAAVYGEPQYLPIDELHPTEPVNDYGRAKMVVENWLNQLAHEDEDWHIIALRLFNVVGIDDYGLLGTSLSDAPRNMISKIAHVASGKLNCLDISGGYYPTSDGTFVRDYIHVMDVSNAFVAAVDYIKYYRGSKSVNIGTGSGTSLKELLQIFETITGNKVPFTIQTASSRNVSVSIANPSLAEKLFDWKPRKGIKEICLSEWIAIRGNKNNFP